jgi:hypothetical protein
MARPVVPNQFAIGKNRIIHKPTTATFSFETGHTTFKSINWGRADEQLEHVPSQLNQGDSLGAKDERVYRH